MRTNFGGNASFFNFVRDAHKNGLKVLIDIEVKSLGVGPLFNSLTNYNNASNIMNTSSLSSWEDYWRRTINSYSLDNDTAARNFVLNALLYWVAPGGDTSIGVDGYRIDSLRPNNGNVEDGGLYITVGNAARQIKPSFFLLAEPAAWDTGSNLYVSQGIDSAFSFPLYTAGRYSFANVDASGVISALQSCYAVEPAGKFHNIILENHDSLQRSATVFNTNLALEKAAAAMLLTVKGIPEIYYGQEIGMGGTPTSSIDIANGNVNGDGLNFPIREPMDWRATRFTPGNTVSGIYLPGYANYLNNVPTTYWGSTYYFSKDNDGISVEEEIGDPNSLLSYYKTLIALRKNHPALLKGTIAWVLGDDNILGYVRNYGGESILVLMNLTPFYITSGMDLTPTVLNGVQDSLSDLLTGSNWTAVTPQNFSNYQVTLAPYQVAVLEASGSSGTPGSVSLVNITLCMTNTSVGLGSYLFYTGNCPELTSWGSGMRGTWSNGSVWYVNVSVPAQDIQFKVRSGSNYITNYESGSNHDIGTPTNNGTYTVEFNGGF
jgi:glycosidase